MNDKMIEEMAKDLKECLPNNWYWQKSVDSDTYFVAKHFYNTGYRNCKDKVVLTKEEYNEIKQYQSYIPEMKKAFDKVHNNAVKETAKEILQSLLDFVNCEKINQGHSFEKIKETLIKVAKTYEVEVEK